jgi:hypothetical protein
MHDPPHATLLAGGKQRNRRIHVDALEIVARAVLERTDAIHHRVDAGKQRMPGCRLRQLMKVGGDPARVGKPPLRFSDAAPCADQIMSFQAQPPQTCRADQTISTGDQHAHATFRYEPIRCCESTCGDGVARSFRGLEVEIPSPVGSGDEKS